MKPKILIAKFPGICTTCNQRFPAGTEIEFTASSSGRNSARHGTVVACANAKTAATPPPAMLDMTPIVAFLQAAQARGLKSPKLRVLAPDGKTELRLGITRGGQAPGSLAVTLGGTFVGCVRPDGRVTNTLSGDNALQRHLLYVAENPANAAKEYAALMSLCSFCGKALTDAGSVEVGYGPICAKHWGLPHGALGSSVLMPVPQTV